MKTAAQMLATTFSGDKSNAGAVEYFYGQLSIFDGDVDAVMGMAKSMVDNGSLAFPTQSETLSFQGPDLPQNRPIDAPLESSRSGQKDITEFVSGKPIEMDDLEGISSKDQDGKFEDQNFGQSAEDMMEAGAPLSSSFTYNEETGERTPSNVPLKPSETITTSGVEVKAYGQQATKLDVSQMKDLTTIRLYEIELKSGGIPLSAEDQALLTAEKERLQKAGTDLTLKEEKDFRRSLAGENIDKLNGIIVGSDWSAVEKQAAIVEKNSRKAEPFNIADYDDVKTATIQTIIDRADTHPTLISERIIQLQTLLANRNAESVPIGDGDTFFIKVTGKDGLPKTVTAKMNQNNEWVDLSNPTKIVKPIEGEKIISREANDALFDNVVKVDQATVVPLSKQRTAMSSTLRSAKKLDDMVNPALGGDPTILTTVGGNLPRFLQGLALEADAFLKTFNDPAKASDIIDNPAQAFMELENVLQRNMPDGVDKKARLAYLFQAEKIKLAFSFAASSMGQSGQGLSNKDFDNAIKAIDSGKDYQTFTTNLREQAASVVAKTSEMIMNFNSNQAIKILRRSEDGLFDGMGLTAEDYSKKINLGDAYTWSQTPYKKPKASTDPEIINDDEGYKALGPGVLYRGKDGKLRKTPLSKIAGEM